MTVAEMEFYEDVREIKERLDSISRRMDALNSMADSLAKIAEHVKLANEIKLGQGGDYKFLEEDIFKK